MPTWIQLYIKAVEEGSAYTTPRAMKRVDDHIKAFGATMKCPAPQTMPMQEPDGTWEVRVQQEAMLPFIKDLLTDHYGLQIVREVPHS